MNKLTLICEKRYIPGYEYLMFRHNLNTSIFDNINEITVFNDDFSIKNYVTSYFDSKIKLITGDYTVYSLNKKIYHITFKYLENISHYKLTEKTIKKIGYFGFINETNEPEYIIDLEENVYYEIVTMLNSLIFDIYIPSNYLDMKISNENIPGYMTAKTINNYLILGKLKLKDIVNNCNLSFILENITNINTLLELYIMCFRNLNDTLHSNLIFGRRSRTPDDSLIYNKINGFTKKRTLSTVLQMETDKNDAYLVLEQGDNEDIIITNKVTNNEFIIKKSKYTDEDFTVFTVYYNTEMLNNDIIMIEDEFCSCENHYHTSNDDKIGYYTNRNHC